jgi:hypothetical protein
MTKKELEEKIGLYEKQVNGLNNEIEKLKIELSKVVEDKIPDFPEFNFGDTIWYKNNAFNVGNYIKSETSKTKDYNNFHTEEYAKEYTEKSREIAMLLHCKWYIDRCYIPDWKNRDEIKYCVTYNHNNKSYVLDYFYDTEYPTVYFSTKQVAKEAADWMNEHYKRNNES